MKPLSNIIVLELGMVLQVPLAGQMLGDYGANVIKIERPPRGDIVRDLDDVGTRQGGESCYYAAVGRNKRSICLDIRSATGKAILKKMILTSDVLLHNFRPGVMERLGLGYEEVRRINPRLVYAESYPYGKSGPLARLPGQDMLAQSMSGMSRNGVGDEGIPRLAATPTVDYTAATSLTQGILAALLERERSGLGDLVSTSLYDVAIAMQLLEVASRTMYGYTTDWLQYSMPLKAKDGWIVVLTLFRENPLRMLCDAFGVDDMSKDPELSDAYLQRQNIHRIYERFGPIVARFTVAECLDFLSKTDILSAPMLDLNQTLDHEQTKENGILWEVEVPGRGPVTLAGNPIRLQRNPLTVDRRVDALGESSGEILAEFGYSSDQIERFKADGVLGVIP